jgi:hypothetical protein
MGIPAYQIDTVIKAYKNQENARFRRDAQSGPSQGRYTDVVTLSKSEGITPDIEAVWIPQIGKEIHKQKTAMGS